LVGGGSNDNVETCSAQGDSDGGQGDSWHAAESKIRQYLDVRRNNGGRGDEFLIQGWRWHTMALAREATRLYRLTQLVMAKNHSSSSDDLEAENPESAAVDAEALRRAAEYVVGFNMKGLHRIERDLFFPWVQEQVVDPLARSDRDMSSAVRVVMDQLDHQRRTIDKLGQSLVSRLRSEGGTSISFES
jgi:hypothetical protein